MNSGLARLQQLNASEIMQNNRWTHEFIKPPKRFLLCDVSPQSTVFEKATKCEMPSVHLMQYIVQHHANNGQIESFGGLTVTHFEKDDHGFRAFGFGIDQSKSGEVIQWRIVGNYTMKNIVYSQKM
jgi:hypothetical protein